jgi:hypothetical protein
MPQGDAFFEKQAVIWAAGSAFVIIITEMMAVTSTHSDFKRLRRKLSTRGGVMSGRIVIQVVLFFAGWMSLALLTARLGVDYGPDDTDLTRWVAALSGPVLVVVGAVSARIQLNVFYIYPMSSGGITLSLIIFVIGWSLYAWSIIRIGDDTATLAMGPLGALMVVGGVSISSAYEAQGALGTPFASVSGEDVANAERREMLARVPQKKKYFKYIHADGHRERTHLSTVGVECVSENIADEHDLYLIKGGRCGPDSDSDSVSDSGRSSSDSSCSSHSSSDDELSELSEQSVDDVFNREMMFLRTTCVQRFFSIITAAGWALVVLTHGRVRARTTA